MTQPTPVECLLDVCTQQCTTECREVINRAWHSLRGTTPAEQPVRHTVDTITSDQLDALQDELDALKTIASGYCGHCGRGDCSPTADQWYEQRQRADRAEAAIERVRETVVGRRTEVAEFEAENEPSAWSDAVTVTCSRIEDALRERPESQGVALDEHQEQPLPTTKEN